MARESLIGAKTRWAFAGAAAATLLVAQTALSVLLLASSVSGKVPWIGRLPGDIYIERGNFRFYFPLATSILLSIVLTVILSLFWRR